MLTEQLIRSGVPGKVIVIARAFVNGASVPHTLRSDGRHITYTFPEDHAPSRGRTLAEWRQRFGGDEGTLRDPYLRQPRPISLRPWADADPDTTRLCFDFTWEPDQPINAADLPGLAPREQ